MIKAYEEGWKPYNKTQEEYINKTTITNNPKEVYYLIKEYLDKNNCIDEVITFLYTYVLNPKLINKTHIVWDGSGRNCTILVRPDGIVFTNNSVNTNKKKTLKLFEEQAETIFLILSKETWEELDEDSNLYRELCESYYGWDYE